VERWKGLGFLEDRPIVVVDPEVERVVPYHAEHQPVAEDAGLAEHTPHCDPAERGELLTQELGKTVAGNHPPHPLALAPARRSLLLPLCLLALAQVILGRTRVGARRRAVGVEVLLGDDGNAAVVAHADDVEPARSSLIHPVAALQLGDHTLDGALDAERLAAA